MTQLTIDWISVTYPDRVPVEETELMFEGDWARLDHGGQGYRCSLRNGYVAILHDGNPGMGHHLRLSSQGLRQVEGQYDFPGWPRWLRRELQRGAKPTRIDLALDDYQGYLDFPTIVDHLKRRHLTTRYRHWGHSQEHWFEPQKDRPEAQSVWIGSRSSSTYLRIYNRAAKLGLSGHLVRFEIECKKSAARRVAQAIANASDDAALGCLAVGVLRNLIDFRTLEDNAKLYRAPLAPWWAKFCEEAEKVKLGLGRPSRTLEKTKKWLDRQAAPSIATVINSLQEKGESAEEWLANLIASGQNRLSQGQEQMIKELRCSLRPRITVWGRAEAQANPNGGSLDAEGPYRGGKDGDQ